MKCLVPIQKTLFACCLILVAGVLGGCKDNLSVFRRHRLEVQPVFTSPEDARVGRRFDRSFEGTFPHRANNPQRSVSAQSAETNVPKFTDPDEVVVMKRPRIFRPPTQEEYRNCMERMQQLTAQIESFLAEESAKRRASS